MDNLLQDWINSDKKLHDLLIEIQSLDLSPLEQAEVAFNRL